MDIEHVDMPVGLEVDEAGDVILDLRDPRGVARASLRELFLIDGVWCPRSSLRNRVVACREDLNGSAELVNETRYVGCTVGAGERFAASVPTCEANVRTLRSAESTPRNSGMEENCETNFVRSCGLDKARRQSLAIDQKTRNG